MRMSWKGKGLAAMLAIALVSSGCTGGGTGQVQSGEQDAGAIISNDEMYQFPLEMPVELEIFANTMPQVKKDYNDMQMFKDLQERTNVKVNWSLVSNQMMSEKKNIMIAGGDLPDAFYGRAVLTKDEIVKLGSSGALIPLEGMIEKYAPNLKKIFDQRPEYKKLATAPDGHIYALPTIIERNFNTIQPVLFINKKWLDQLGLQTPTTTDEFYAVLKEFKEKDPNGNGTNDEIPFSFIFNEGPSGSNSLAGSFGVKMDVNTNHLYVEEGKVKYAPAQPEYEDYLSYLSKLYKERLLDQEVFTHAMNAYTTKIRSEELQVGAFFGYSLTSIFGEDKRKQDYFPLLPLKGPNGNQGGWMRGVPAVIPGSFAITNKNKKPELTLQWLDTMLEGIISFQFLEGPIGVRLQENSDGTLQIIPAPEGMNSDELKHSEAPGNGSMTIVLDDVVQKFVDPHTKEKIEYYNMYDPYAPTDLIPNTLWSFEDSQNVTTMELDLHGKNAYYSSFFANFVMNGFTDSDWRNHLSQLQKLKIDDYIDLYQKNYDAYLGN